MATSDSIQTCPHCRVSLPEELADDPGIACPACGKGVSESAGKDDVADTAGGRIVNERLELDATVAIDSEGTTTSPIVALGEVLAERFRIVRPLGTGGMGEVFLAEDLEIGSPVAVKVVKPWMVESAEAASRLKREVRLARDVTHPNVCRTYDLYRHRRGDDQAPLILVSMELLTGEDLAQRIKRGPLSADETVPILRQIARGLFAAHRLGIVHRDLKPSNVLLVPETGGTRAVVTDFGIACQTEAARTQEDLTLTQTGMTLGSPAYMAPEQITGQPTSPATDVYALGVVAYEMLTGQQPFQGDSLWLVVTKRLTEEPVPIEELVPDLDPRLRAFTRHCLARDPAERFAHMDEVLQFLDLGDPGWEAYGRKSASLSSAVRAQRKRWPLLVAAGAGVLVILALIVLGPWRGEVADPPEVGTEATLDTVQPDENAPRDAERGVDVPAEIEDSAAGPGEAVAISPAVAAVIDAAQAALDRLDGQSAREVLAEPLAAEPENPHLLAHLADAWMLLGHDGQAAQAAENARRVADGLPREQQLAIETRLLRATGKWQEARDLAFSLSNYHPENLRYGLWAVEALLSVGETAEAVMRIDQLRALPEPARNDPRIDLWAARTAQAAARFRDQIARAQSAFDRGREIDASLLMAEARLVEAVARVRLGEVEQAMGAAQAAYDLAEEADDSLRRADAKLQLAMATFFRGDLDEARRMAEDALIRFEDLGNLQGQVRAHDIIASTRQASGDLDRAEHHLTRAFELSEVAGVPVLTNRVRHNLADLGKAQGRFDEALTRYQEARTVYAQQGDARGEARVQMTLATLELRLGRPSKALDSATAAQRWFAEHQETRPLGFSSVAKSRALFALGRLSEAEDEVSAVLASEPEAPVLEAALTERVRQLLAKGQSSQGSAGPDASSSVSNREIVDVLERLERTAQAMGEPSRIAAAEGLQARAEMAAQRDYDAVTRLTPWLRGNDVGDVLVQAQLEHIAAEAYLERSRTGLARAALERAREHLSQTRHQEIEWRGEILRSRVLASQAPRRALRRLAEIEKRAATAGFLIIALEARFHRGRLGKNQDVLAALAETASSNGFEGVVRAVREDRSCTGCF